MLWNKWSTSEQAQFKILSGRCCKIYSHDRQITYSYLANGFRIAFWCEGFSMQAWNKLKKQLMRAYITCKSLHAGAGSSLATSGSFRALFRFRPGSGMGPTPFCVKHRLVRLLARAPPQRTNGLMRGMIVSGSQDRGNSLMIVIAPLAA